jgi:serine/threonine protein kinase
VALKIIKPEEDETWEDMMTEVKILKYSNHPNLIKLYGAWRKKDELFVRIYPFFFIYFFPLAS